MKNNSHPNLSNFDGSMSNILKNNLDKINNCTSNLELINVVNKIFNENNLNTNASRRLLQVVQTSKNLTNSISAIYNSILAGDNLETIKLK